MINMLTSKFKKLSRNRNKGFTLVEMIVVLVILAILLAILVPSMTGWITKAKEKQILVEARSAYLASQTIISEDFALDDPVYIDGNTIDSKTLSQFQDEVAELGGVSGTVSDFTLKDNAAIAGMTYTTDTYKAVLANGAWSVGDVD